jgi:hypothetical protein
MRELTFYATQSVALARSYILDYSNLAELHIGRREV